MQKELVLLGEAAIKYAEKEGVTNITGRDFQLKVVESEYLAFPRSGEEGRDKLESLLKKMKVWEGVSTLSLSKLSNLVEGDEIAGKQSKQILRFAETETNCSVKLLKKDRDE